MGIISDLKNNIKKEISAHKYNRDLENDPDVVRNRLDAERKQINLEREKIQAQKQIELDRQELRSLKNSTGLRGRLSEGMKSFKGHLAEVQKRNKTAENYKLKNPQSSIVSGKSVNMFEIKGSGSEIQNTKLKGVNGNYRPFGSGVMGDVGVKRSDSPFGSGVLGDDQPKPKKEKSKSIIIKVQQ